MARVKYTAQRSTLGTEGERAFLELCSRNHPDDVDEGEGKLEPVRIRLSNSDGSERDTGTAISKTWCLGVKVRGESRKLSVSSVGGRVSS